MVAAVKVPLLYAPTDWAVLVATGPTLSDEQAVQVDGVRKHLWLFGCNDAYRMFPDLNVHYACDPTWWNHHGEACRHLPAAKWTQDEGAAAAHKINYVAGDYQDSLSTDPNKIHYGNNSGFQLMNLAYLMGIRQMILIGYTMNVATTERPHFFGKHPIGLRNIDNYTQFVHQFNTIRCGDLGLKVVNATPGTALRCFPQLPLEQALEQVVPRPQRL